MNGDENDEINLFTAETKWTTARGIDFRRTVYSGSEGVKQLTTPHASSTAIN